MPRANFARGLAFALLAAVGLVPFDMLVAPQVGYAGALGLYLLCTGVAHLALIAPRLRTGLAACGLASAAALLLGALEPGPGLAAMGVAMTVGLVRSAWYYPRPALRALWLEASLWLPAMALAGIVYDGSLVGSALAVWVFWLVQSLFALLPASAPAPDSHATDPFERAMGSAERILAGE